MAVLTFLGESYTVDHAVKGADYVHGYDANGVCIVAFEDMADLTAIGYDGTFMAPGDCEAEVCNKVVYCGGKLKTLGGVEIIKGVAVSLPASGWAGNAQTANVAGVAAGSIVIVSAAPESRDAWNDAEVYCSGQGNGTLTFACGSVPTANITANVVILV